jgi:arabinogalactan endo-1,4-beta-galactosidase
MKTTLTILFALAAGWACSAPAWAAGFTQGADISFLPQIEAAGGVFSADGDSTELLSILRDHGLNTIRLRLWHSPADGHSGLAETLALAQRVRAAGFDLLLDFHYSDTWADPGHQTKPKAWASLPFAALADSVRCYTRDALAAFDAIGCPPTIVQIGNEITPGMLWSDGRVAEGFDSPQQWANLGDLLKAAVAGVEEGLPGDRRPEIMIHIDRGADNAGARRFIDKVISRGVAFDLIGLSYYPWWHGSLAKLKTNVDDLASRYGRDLILVETAYPWTLGWFDDTHNPVGMPKHLLPGYPATPEGQRNYLAAVIDIVRGAPDGKGRGVFWWAPEWIATPGFGSSWENVTLFDDQGAALPALDGFNP